MSKPLVLTCDIGTQSARALLVDPDGRIVDVVQSKYAEPYFSKEPGWAEQKPNFYFDRLCECCRELCARSNALLPDVIAMTITVIRRHGRVSGREQRAPARHHSLAGQAHR